MPRTRLEAATDKLANNGNAVRPVESDGGDVEDGGNGDVRTKSDKVDGRAPEDGEPDGNDRGVGAAVDNLPVLGSGDETVAGEGEDGTGQGLDGDHADGVDDQEGANAKYNGAVTSEVVVEDLNDRLLERAGEDVGRFAHDEGEHNGVEPADDVGQSHGDEDGPRSLGLWLVNLLGDVSSSIVVGHGPGDGQESEKERPSDRSPTRCRLRIDVGEDIAGIVAVRAHGQQSDAASQDAETVEDDVGGGDLGQPLGAQRVEHTVKDGHASLDGDGVAGGWAVATV